MAHLNVQRYRIQCQGTVHTVEFEVAETCRLRFLDHEPEFQEHWERKVAFALLDGRAEQMSELITPDDGCRRVVCYLAGGPGNHVNRDPEERRLIAALRGFRLGHFLRLRQRAVGQ